MALIVSQLLYLSVMLGIVISDVKSENIILEEILVEFRNSSCRTELTCPEPSTVTKIASVLILIYVQLIVVPLLELRENLQENYNSRWNVS